MDFELRPALGSGDHVTGPGHAIASIVEFGDYECPNCKQAAPVVKLLLGEFHGRLRFAFRHFPLEGVHRHAVGAALAAECAAAQGKFWAMHDLLFELQHSLNPRQLHAHAETLELDMARFTAEMN